MFRTAALALAAAALTVAACAPDDAAAPDGDAATIPATADATAAEVSQPVDVAGGPLGEFDPATGGRDQAMGQPAPVVDGVNFEGGPIRVGDTEPGSAQLVMFTASWCPACQQEMEQLTDWFEENDLPDNVELVAVSTLHDDSRENWPPQPWMETEGFPLADVLVDDVDSSVADAYGLTATPYWVMVNGDGLVTFRYAGIIPSEEFDAFVQTVAADA